MTSPSGLRTKPTLKNRPGNSGWRALAWPIRNAFHCRASAPSASVSGPGTSIAHSRERLVIEIEDLVVEALQGTFRNGDQAYRQVQAGQPRRGLDQVRDVLDVDADLVAVADAPHGGNQADGLVGLDHDRPFGALFPLFYPTVPFRVCTFCRAAGQPMRVSRRSSTR